MKDLFEKIRFIFKKRASLSSEAFEAYYNKLPEKIAIDWFRDGKFIIGNIYADGEKFMTQGKSVDDFIEMVNDVIFSVYEIPKEYFPLLVQSRRYYPNEAQLKDLQNTGLTHSKLGIQKRELAHA
jgi:hypothetical protein